MKWDDVWYSKDKAMLVTIYKGFIQNLMDTRVHTMTNRVEMKNGSHFWEFTLAATRVESVLFNGRWESFEASMRVGYDRRSHEVG